MIVLIIPYWIDEEILAQYYFYKVYVATLSFILREEEIVRPRLRLANELHISSVSCLAN